MTSAGPADVVVIGAGPAGLAVAGALAHRGRQAVVLERRDAVGHSWRNHYERLHLHTPRSVSSLPHHPFPAEVPTYPSREQVVRYLESYAQAMGIQPRFGVEVQRIQKDGDGYTLETSKGALQAAQVVVASGYNAVPRVPNVPGKDTFAGTLLHSHAYRNAVPFKGKRVLVVGCGNSGAEIALDLAENDVHTTLVVRGPVHLLSRDVGPIPAVHFAIALSHLPVSVADTVGRTVSRLRFGDLSRFGITAPSLGPISTVHAHGRIPLIDIGTIGAIQAGRIAVRPNLVALDASSATFADGKTEPFDVILWATGYTTGLAAFVPDADTILDERGRPRAFGRPLASHPGLTFVGFTVKPTGALREIRIEAERVAKLLAPAT